MLAANHDVQSLSYFDETTGAREMWALTYQGKAFNSPNDLAVRGDGNVYFLTRSGGVEGIHPTLCRAGGSSADCVVLPPYVDLAGQEELVVDDIIARPGGTIYLRSGAHLLRLDFPA